MWTYAAVLMLATAMLCRKKIVAYATLLRCYSRPTPRYTPPIEYGTDEEDGPPILKND